MNWIDITSLAIILIFALMGLYRGFLRSIFRIVAWIAGIAGSYCAHLFLSDFIIENFDISSGAVKPTCLIIGFVVPFTFAQLVGHFLHTAVSHSIISKPNRFMGALFGVIKASIICFILLTIMHFLPLKEGTIYDLRETAVAYDIYKTSLEMMGYPTEQKSIIKKAEKQAIEIKNKATEKMRESAEDIADKTKEAAINAADAAVNKIVDEAVDKAKDAAIDAAENVKKSAGDAKENVKDAAKETTEDVSPRQLQKK